MPDGLNHNGEIWCQVVWFTTVKYDARWSDSQRWNMMPGSDSHSKIWHRTYGTNFWHWFLECMSGASLISSKFLAITISRQNTRETNWSENNVLRVLLNIYGKRLMLQNSVRIRDSRSYCLHRLRTWSFPLTRSRCLHNTWTVAQDFSASSAFLFSSCQVTWVFPYATFSYLNLS